MLPHLRLFLFAALCLVGLNAVATNSASGPPDSDGPVVVDIGFMLSGINAINEEDETFDFEGVLTMQWHDPRLAFDPAETGYDQLYFQGTFQFNEVFSYWWPQVFLANEAGRFDREGVLLRITPDGQVYYTEEIDAIAKSRLKLARYPFDQQQLTAIFEVLGFDSQQVILRADNTKIGMPTDEHHQVRVPQWQEPKVSASIVTYAPKYLADHEAESIAFRVHVDIKRNPWYTLRLVALPVMIFVMLSWSVFWMDRSSVGDRMDISFIGILTVVAYQIMFSENLPKISYVTLLMSFMIISFLTMCANVAVNLRVAALDHDGRTAEGNLMDRRCRYIFPLIYVSANALVGAYIYYNGQS